MVFEVPSGIFCDAQGRRKGYLVGMLFTLIGTLFLFSRILPLLFVGFAFNGIGRAFSSGSLDALLIDSHLKDNRPLDDVMVAMEITSSLALAFGSLCGGFLLALGKGGVSLTDYLLLVRGALKNIPSGNSLRFFPGRFALVCKDTLAVAVYFCIYLVLGVVSVVCGVFLD
ncbi:MAG: MFS transporter [Sphaerochaeta sp.]|nr:MFS transporter [Sphaerochaeta sp.]